LLVLFVKVPRPGDSEGNFAVILLSCHLGKWGKIRNYSGTLLDNPDRIVYRWWTFFRDSFFSPGKTL